MGVYDELQPLSDPVIATRSDRPVVPEQLTCSASAKGPWSRMDRVPAKSGGSLPTVHHARTDDPSATRLSGILTVNLGTVRATNGAPQAAAGSLTWLPASSTPHA